jgi:hypothetical protein
MKSRSSSRLASKDFSTVYLSARSPGKARESNWLPSGDSVFNLSLRIYTPEETFLKDRTAWRDPKPEVIRE